MRIHVFFLPLFFMFTSSLAHAWYNPLPSAQELCAVRALMSALAGTEYHRTYYGSEYADVRTQVLVQDIKQRMGFAEGYKVHVMYLNATGYAHFGVENLIAFNNTIFIDRHWFDTLSFDEQRFLLAHELAHIYTQDARVMALIVTAALAATGYNLSQVLCDPEAIGGYVGFIGFCCLVIPAYGRYLEQRADARAAHHLGTCTGGIACFKRWMQYEHEDNEQWRLTQFWCDMFATHPTPQRRIEALEELTHTRI